MNEERDLIADAISTFKKDFIALVNKKCHESYKKGKEDGEEKGYSDAVFEFEEQQEKTGVDYAVEQFKDCQSFDDFKEKYKEAYNRHLNYMPTLGLSGRVRKS